ncbi:MAG: hypothetical protein Q9183_005540, partial [Haloplaca sp. 2 TL-2023]
MTSILTGNKFDPNKDIPDLSGKVFIITGGTAGIGFGITAHILQHNPEKIVLLSQKEQHADEAMEELKKYGDTTKVQWVQLDLKDLKQTDSVAKQLQSEKQIDAQAVDAYGTKAKVGASMIKPFMKDPVDEGCRSALFAATSEDVVKEKIQGAY